MLLICHINIWEEGGVGGGKGDICKSDAVDSERRWDRPSNIGSEAVTITCIKKLKGNSIVLREDGK